MFTDKNPKVPLMTYTDSNPVPFKYIGFASWDNSLVEFFYNCTDEDKMIEQAREEDAPLQSPYTLLTDNYVPPSERDECEYLEPS